MRLILARGLFHLKRLLVARYGLLLSVAALVMLHRRAFHRLELESEHWLALTVAALLLVALPFRLLVSRPPDERKHPRRNWFHGVERGLVVLSLLYIGLQATGGPESWLQPAAYLVVALLVGFNRAWIGSTVTLLALGMQALLHLADGSLRVNPEPFLVQSMYLLAFASAGLLSLRVEVARHRREHRQRLRDELKIMRQEAQDFRLISSSLTGEGGRDRATDELKQTRGAVASVHQDMLSLLTMLKDALRLHTCVLLWLDQSGDRLKVKELVSDSEMVRRIPVPSRAGLLGNVVKNRILLNLRRPPSGNRGIPYYDGPEEVGVFAGVPVMEDEHLRGVLCADRLDEDKPFTPREEKVLQEAALHVLRSIQTERVLTAVERSKYEHERFYRASSMLNTALGLSKVYETAFAAAEEIASFDFAALTLFDSRKRGRHIIVATRCDERTHKKEKYEGVSFGANTGLVSMVVKNRHYLPAGGEPRERDTVVFTKRLRLKGMSSILVLPLVVNNEAIGTFALASQGRWAYTGEVREMLGVISNQVAISLANAKMYKRMEEMATTDGLTGLPNHRTFQNRLTEMLARAERTDKPLSVVLTDIDKFKNVNDTYGHPVGDEVLRRVAKVMAGQVRKVDIVARYGGEEFVMVLEETDAAGAALLCERVRKEIAAQVMNSDQGHFRVTISLGIASYPNDGVEKAELVEHADQALYEAKETGRDRTVRHDQIRRRPGPRPDRDDATSPNPIGLN